MGFRKQLSKSSAQKKKESALFVTVLGGLIVEWVKGFPFSKWLATGAVAAFAWLRVPMVLERWYFYLLFCLSGCLCLLGVARVVKRDSSYQFTDYQTDTFLGLKWLWRYSHNRIDSRSFQAYCPDCDLRLTITDAEAYMRPTQTQIVCTECGYAQVFDGGAEQLERKLELLVDREIRKQSASLSQRSKA